MTMEPDKEIKSLPEVQAIKIPSPVDLTEKELDALLALSDSEYEEFTSSMEPGEAAELTKRVREWNAIPVDKSCAKFRSQLMIDNDGKLVKFTDVIEPWQREDFVASDPSWMSIIHGTPLKTSKFFWRERARGHSKTTDISCLALCAIYSAPKKISGVAGAASKDQARIVRDAIDTLVRANPWLQSVIDVQNYVIKNKATGSVFEIISSDESTSYGKTVNFCICDELTHWKNADLWNSLFSTAGKKKNCILSVLTNAGMGRGQSWQWNTREKARTLPNWHFSCHDGPKASWITPQVLEDQKNGLTSDNAFRRLWMNLWCSDSGTGLDLDDIDTCMSFHDGPLNEYEPDKFGAYIAAVDMALKHDFSGFVIIALNLRRRKFRLAHCKVWKPNEFPNGKISPAAVQQYIWNQLKKYRCLGLVFDVWQWESSAEWIESQFDSTTGYSCPTYPYEPTPNNLSVMATTLIRCLRNQEIEMYPQKELRADFSKMSIKETIGGFRITAARDDETGHADLGTALAMCLPFCDITMKDFLGIE